jgi:hypothetical protein
VARMPGAEWRPIRPGNYTPDGQVEVRGVVVHIMAGTLRGTESWFNNPTADASSHFGTGRLGALWQWVDTKDRAWAQGDGNRSWISVENEGFGGDKLTKAQLHANARVLAWAHQTYGDVPLVVTTDPRGRGLGHHGMGGRAWGNHTACPGTPIVAQKAEIVRLAKLIVAGATLVVEEDIVAQLPLIKPGNTGSDVKTVFYLLAARGYPIAPVINDTTMSPRVVDRLKEFQREEDLDDDGIVGPKTWAKLLRL